MCNNLIRGIIPLGGNQMNRILAVAILLGVTGCSYTQPYVTNIAPAGKNGILVEKCKIKFTKLTSQISDESCLFSILQSTYSLHKQQRATGVNL
jgi:hypothetical protein